MAAFVAREAEATAAAIRALTEQAQEIATLAAAMDGTAAELERQVRQHHGALAVAQDALAEQRPAIAALERSPERLSEISRTVQKIARQSHILSINARIEAARCGPEARGFAAVAAEIAGLSKRTQSATSEIGQSSNGITMDVQAARAIVESHDGLIVSQSDLLGAAVRHAERQKETASTLATLASDSAERVSAAASSIGRVGATAVAVKMLAREIAKRT